MPYVYDVDLTMEYNNDLFSGIADTYLGVRAKPHHSSLVRDALLVILARETETVLTDSRVG